MRVNPVNRPLVKQWSRWRRKADRIGFGDYKSVYDKEATGYPLPSRSSGVVKISGMHDSGFGNQSLFHRRKGLQRGKSYSQIGDYLEYLDLKLIHALFPRNVPEVTQFRRIGSATEIHVKKASNARRDRISKLTAEYKNTQKQGCSPNQETYKNTGIQRDAMRDAAFHLTSLSFYTNKKRRKDEAINTMSKYLGLSIKDLRRLPNSKLIEISTNQKEKLDIILEQTHTKLSIIKQELKKLKSEEENFQKAHEAERLHINDKFTKIGVSCELHDIIALDDKTIVLLEPTIDLPDKFSAYLRAAKIPPQKKKRLLRLFKLRQKVQDST